MNVTGGTTDVTTYFALRLTASGAEATALDVTTFDLQYVRTGSAPSAKVDATALAATDSAHADNKAIEIDATDQPGLYRVDWPDAAFVAGVREVILTVKCATCFTEHLRVTIDAPVNVVQLGGDTQSATDLKDFADAGYDPATNKVQGVVLVDTLTTYTGNTVQTGDAYARLGAPAGASVSADILAVDNLVDDLESRLGTPSDLGSGATVAANLADIEAQTDDIGAAGAGLTAIPWNAAWDAEVQSEVDDALIAKGLDHLVFTSVAGTDIADDSIIAKLVSKSATADWDTFDNTTDALEASRDNIGTAGAGLTAADDAVIAAIGALNNITAASVWAVGTRTLTAGTNIDGSTFTAIPWNAAWDAEVQSEVADGLTAYGVATSANVSAVETDTQDIQSRLPAALTVGGNIKADVLAISGDTTAADNAESFFDGTGYAGTNNVIPTVTTVTNLTNAPTSGDLTATMKTSVTAACTASSPTMGQLPSDGLDLVLVESGIAASASLTNDAGSQLTSLNVRQALALCSSVLAGVLSGGATTTNTIKAGGNASSNSRVVATVDSSGNRSALTIKVPT